MSQNKLHSYLDKEKLLISDIIYNKEVKIESHYHYFIITFISHQQESYVFQFIIVGRTHKSCNVFK